MGPSASVAPPATGRRSARLCSVCSAPPPAPNEGARGRRLAGWRVCMAGRWRANTSRGPGRLSAPQRERERAAPELSAPRALGLKAAGLAGRGGVFERGEGQAGRSSAPHSSSISPQVGGGGAYRFCALSSPIPCWRPGISQRSLVGPARST